MNLFFLMHLFTDYLLGLKGLWFHPSPKEVAVDISTLQPVRPLNFCHLFSIDMLVFPVRCMSADHSRRIEACSCRSPALWLNAFASLLVEMTNSLSFGVHYSTYPTRPICMQVLGETGEGPTSPWISFRVLFAMIQDNISSVARELLFHHYEELKVLSSQQIMLYLLALILWFV